MRKTVVMLLAFLVLVATITALPIAAETEEAATVNEDAELGGVVNITPSEMLFDFRIPAGFREKNITISNDGEELLRVFSIIEEENKWWLMLKNPGENIDVLPGESVEVTVGCLYNRDKEGGVIVLETSDPENATVTVNVTVKLNRNPFLI